MGALGARASLLYSVAEEGRMIGTMVARAKHPCDFTTRHPVPRVESREGGFALVERFPPQWSLNL